MMPALDQTSHDVLEHGVLRFITAGSVDDGKSTLIGRLLYDTKAILADQLAAIDAHVASAAAAAARSVAADRRARAEREQGITIDVAYRYFATPKRKFIIADTPGHEQYTRNMVTGASTADAGDPARRRTARRASRRPGATRRIAHLLRIPHLVVAVNKMDLVDLRPARFRRDRRRLHRFRRTQSGMR